MLNTNILLKALFIFILSISTVSAQNERPKIGLTLSGGGAKGIAHLGLLKAIDSAGIKVDYVTGTSMGSIVGGLYAAGYKTDTIIQIAKKLDWNIFLSNDAPYSTFNLKEKENYGHYIDLPLDKGKLTLRRGILESNELWLALEEFFYPFYDITDFSKFDKSFECIATDLATGEIVVLREGNIVKAIRASMAIPSIFTPVEIDGKVLVDGGIVRNFPVSNVKEMGADIVIGSDVSGKMASVEEVRSPLDIIGRLPFYNAVSDLKEQKKLVDIYIDYPLDDYGTGSFSSADEIMEIGLKRGRELYPALKRMKDSLDLIYGEEIITPKIIKTQALYITESEVSGIPADEVPFFLELVSFTRNSYHTPADLTDAVRKALATDIYSKINYSVVPGKSGAVKVLFEVEKLPSTFARFGFNYNSATGIGVKIGLLKRGFINPYSVASCMFSLGENPRGKATFTYYFSKERKTFLQAETNIQTLDIITYDADFKESGIYNQGNQNFDMQFAWLPNNKLLLGTGTTVSSVLYRPKIALGRQADGSVVYVNTYLFAQHNTLNSQLYPTRGQNFYCKAGILYDQHPDYKIYEDDVVIANQDSPGFSSDPYTQVNIAFEQYFPVFNNALFINVQSGMNFNYKQTILNEFMVGGLTNVVRNQVTFAGLPEASIFTGSAVSAQIGYQHEILSNFFLIGRVNGLCYDFITSNYRTNKTSYGLGGALTAGYKTFFGPIETSLMYSDLNRKLVPYFNIGYILNI